MKENSFSISSVKEYHEKGDTDGLLSSLQALKHHLKGGKNINDVDRETYEILIKLITYPNTKIIDFSLSILATCCIDNENCELFNELGGFPHLILIIKTVDNDDILCRACRLLGNLASNRSLAENLNSYDIAVVLLKGLESIDDKSSGTLLMIFRAIKKLLAVKETTSQMVEKEVSVSLNNCLKLTDRALLMGSMEILILLTNGKSDHHRSRLKITGDLISNLTKLSGREDLADMVLKCLSCLICRQTYEVWKFLEESRISDVYVRYIQKTSRPAKGVFYALHKLCSEGATRNKIKNAGLFPKLMKFSMEPGMEIVMMIFSLFQFDHHSIIELAKDKEFINLLVRNASRKYALRLLTVIVRLDPPVRELITNENLSIILSNKECHGILRKMTQTRKFLCHLILTGRIWEISRANCLVGDCDHYVEAFLVHVIQTGEKEESENAALAVPYLVKPRYGTLYNILSRNNGIGIILRLLKERYLDEPVLATIIKLISIFRDNFYQEFKGSREFFDDSPLDNRDAGERRKKVDEEEISLLPAFNNTFHNYITEEMKTVTFELDAGDQFIANKTLLCRNSPAFNAMLNGHFMEAKQENIRLWSCSSEALQKLELLLTGRADIMDLRIETHLELITLTDKFLLASLCGLLTASVPLNQTSCPAIFRWCRQSGWTRCTNTIRKKTYEFIFSSTSNLLVIMKNEPLRIALIDEISAYLSSLLSYRP